MGQCPAEPEEHRALGSDPPVDKVPFPGEQDADSPYRSRRRRGCGRAGRRSRSRQGALGRRRRPAHTAPESPRSGASAAGAAPEPALAPLCPAAGTSQAHGGHGPRVLRDARRGPPGQPGPSTPRCRGRGGEVPPGGDAGGSANSRETSSKLPREVWDRPEVQPPGRAAPSAHISLLPPGHTLLDPHVLADPPGTGPHLDRALAPGTGERQPRGALRASPAKAALGNK